jgi:hypothetical protein
VGLDYRYLLYFERDARFDVLERLAGMAAPTDDGPATIVLPDRSIELPFGTWGHPQRRLASDDTSEPWDFMTVLQFSPDEAIEDYLRHLDGTPPGSDPDRYDELGRLGVGYIYLNVRDDTSGAGEDLVRFAFETPGTSMSIAFLESESIRSSLIDLLVSCRGVYAVFDMEDYADLIWLRGERRDDRLPTADLSLVDIEALVSPEHAEAPTDTPAPLPFSFAAEQVVAGARHARRAAGGSELGVHHWLVALHGQDDSPASVSSQQALASGDLGGPLSEAEVRDRATRLAGQAGRTLVTTQDVAAAVAEAAGTD